MKNVLKAETIGDVLWKENEGKGSEGDSREREAEGRWENI